MFTNGRMDAHDRLSAGYTIYAPPATEIGHRDTFSIYDGLNSQSFMFLDSVLDGDSGDAIPIFYSEADTDSDIADKIVDAIHSSSLLNVTAASISITEGDHSVMGAIQFFVEYEGSERIDLFGAVSVDTDSTAIVSRLIAPRYGGDQNANREKGQIVIEGNSVLYSDEYGIRVEPAARDSAADWPHPGSGRTLNAPLVVWVLAIAGQGVHHV